MSSVDIDVRELYQALLSKAKQHSRFFGRHVYMVLTEDFVVFEAHFTHSRNILNRHINLRTKHAFMHIHAIKKGDWITFHIDYANPDKSIVLVLAHLLVDVVPYFSSRLLR